MKTIRLAGFALMTLMFCASAQFEPLSRKAFSDVTASLAAKTEKPLPASNKALVHAAGRGNPWINLRDGQALPAVYTGATSARQAIEPYQANPLALATDDFDEDGVPDLVCGYADASGGLLALHRGNVDAIYPNSDEARLRKAAGTFGDSPFLASVFVFAVPEAVDFLATGDFDADGHWDILTAARGSSALCLLSGDGHGRFAPVKIKQLPGAVTAMASGEINRRDGLADFVVGITGAQGSQALVFESSEGAWRGAYEVFAVPAEVTALALGQLDEKYPIDLVVAAGHQALIVHGRDRGLLMPGGLPAKVPNAVIDKITLPFAIKAMALGNFNSSLQTEIALLAEGGEVRLLHRHKQQSKKPQLKNGAAAWQSKILVAGSWPNATQLIRAKVSSIPGDDLILLDGSRHQMQILSRKPPVERGADVRIKSSSSSHILAASLDVEGEPLAVLPMRLNVDALSDLVIFKSGLTSLAIVSTVPVSTFVVNSSGNGGDCDPNDGICSTGTIDPNTGQCVLTGECTLQAACDQAGHNPGADTIIFNVSSVAAPLDGLLSAFQTTIDGTSSPTGRVQVTGSYLAVLGNNVVRGLTIPRIILESYVSSDGSLVGGGNIIEGNFIGTNASGTGFVSDGLIEDFDAVGINIIGGTAAAARNIIAKELDVLSSRGDIIRGNYIGTNVTGNVALGGGNSLSIFGVNATIGGTMFGARNIINGVLFPGEAALIQGNYIGTNAAGTSGLGNPGRGLGVGSQTTIGGTSIGAGNLIAFNGGPGIILGGTNTLILSNSIFSNTGLGIDLGGDGVTLNDFCDDDTGANNLQNYPVLTSATSSGGSTTIAGTLNSTANTTFRIEFFSNSACDASGRGEGQTLIGATTVTADSSCNASFNVTLPIAVPNGRFITATATDAAGNTSEFSQCRVVASTPQNFHLTVMIEGSGSVISNPGGINCPGDCTEDYTSGTQVTLLPMRGNGEEFIRWEGDCSGNGPCTFAMTGNHSVKAIFARRFNVKVDTEGPGSGTVEVDGQVCFGGCSYQFAENAQVMLTASPSGLSQFTGWKEDCTGVSRFCTIIVDKDKHVVATFSGSNDQHDELQVTKPFPFVEQGRRAAVFWQHVAPVTLSYNKFFRRSSSFLDAIENVKIELSRDAGVIFETLFASTLDDGSECWLVTGPPTDQAIIRISSINNPLISGISERPFKIIGSTGAGGDLPIGSAICADLGGGDGRSQIKGGSFYADRYAFSGSAGQPLAIALTSSAFDTYVSLIAPNGAVIAQDDNGGGGTTARVPAGGGFFNLPASGTYTIEVTSATANATGDYLLNVSAPTPTLTSLQLLYKNKPVDHLTAGNKAKKYQLTLTGGGFTADSKVLINGTPTETSVASSTTLTARLPFKRVPGAGMITIQVLNPDGQLTGTLTVEVRND